MVRLFYARLGMQMNRQVFASLIGVVAAASVWQVGAQPNIVLIMADDLGYGDLGCYGSVAHETPHLDALAESGLRFTDYHSNGTVCSPTRASLMTGRYPQRTGVEGVVTALNHRDVGLPLEELTIAELLRNAGYDTAIFGKWHLGYDTEFGPTRQGFDTFEGFVSGNIDYQSKIDQVGEADWWIDEERRFEPGYLTTVITDRAVDWIAGHPDGPFFLYISHGAPHYPYQGPDDEGFRVEGEARVASPRRDVDAAYDEMVSAMDDSVGRIVAAIHQHGLEENTLIVFCSDNGCAGRVGSSGPWHGHKGQVYEGGHRVPLIASLPGTFQPGDVSDDLVMSMDLMPTFAALAGIHRPAGLRWDGLDVSMVLDGAPDEPRTVHWRAGNWGATRTGSLKLVVGPNGRAELYDLSVDPGETDDLAADHPEVVDQMRSNHERWLTVCREGVQRVSP